MRIFLIGMMGAGKTTLGVQLAQALDYPFVDMDAYIEQRESRTIAQLFEQEGAERFRELEREALEAVVQEYAQAVIATGGGMPCFHNNMAYINQHGKSVFLDVPETEIVRRLAASDLSVRPLLANKSEAELQAFVGNTLADRRKFYEQARYIFRGEADLESILSVLNKE
ncbi:shikimate kinase [Botryobacter ruber]|uniref:shikimate kinase n=1 Tax=Botryobacter ruber TaxID=2171629 RepID=UPI001F0CAF8B|nr:shikimate kinase [Botryobacter ruber]